MAQYDNPVLYFSQYSLQNTYLILIAFLYSPVTSFKPKPKPSQGLEKNAILSSFYEAELPEIEDVDFTVKGEHELESLPRDRKKDPSRKAKDKLWQEIMAKAEAEASSSSDSD